MKVGRLNILWSSTPTPSTLVSSRLHPAVTETRLGAEALLTTTLGASTTPVSLARAAATRSLTTRSRRSIWARVRPALSVDGVAATLEARPGAAAADAAPAAASPKRPAPTPRAELTIDSLRSYDLVKPIPVVVESLGDRHYVAEVPDLNISTSASSLSDILIILKDQVAQTYDGLRIKKNLDNEQARQLKILETYIGKARRGWLDRR